MYNSKSFQDWKESQITNKLLYAALLFEFMKSQYLQEIWELQVLDRNSNTRFESIDCDSLFIRSEREFFQWSCLDTKLKFYVYFEFYDPKVKNTELLNKYINTLGIKEINVVLKSSIFGAEGLECFKKYWNLIVSIDHETDESNLIK